MTQTMNPETVEKMANEIIKFLEKKKMWKTDCGLIYNGIHVTHEGQAFKSENLSGVMRIWFEGPLNQALNYGIGDRNYSIYEGLKTIMDKYGCYPEFYSNCDLNVYMD